jgi:hypothetical protein
LSLGLCQKHQPFYDRTRKNELSTHPARLAPFWRQEVEITRITLESTTSDVISLRARPAGSRIKYHVVDEYQTEFSLPQKTSSRPYSLGELIRFLDSVEHPQADLSWKRFGFVLSFNQCNLDCGTDLETLRDFTSVSSDYYPGLASHYAQVMDEWYSVQEKLVAQNRPDGLST